MRLKTTIALFEYWNRIRGQDFAPSRSQIVPSDVRHILSSLFLLEMNESGRIAFRLAGTRICDLFGRDLGSASLRELWAHGDDDIEKTAAGVMEHAIPALLNVTGYSTAGHRASFEIILLPLRSEGVGCDKLLGAIAPVAAASWLEVVPLEFLALDRSRLLHEQLGRQPDATDGEIDDSHFAAERSPSISDTMRRMMSHALEDVAGTNVPFRHG
ncbi:PAS domain-containing protein [Rhizobium sp. Root1220]|uniref:PAS domain-containing protein n=1 Tax=Rhizobium sp. Root1220 TaxID=1736432 RepID=UPI0006FF8F20|nr:PAS domain-containing protein [Rhizobium sp. Root1220]KQV81562.1 hypothetical protein ASC90_04410 [Rhizobium sp. Root1220]